MVPGAVLYDGSIPANGIRLYAIISQCCEDGDGRCALTNEELGRRMRPELAAVSVSRLVGSLKKAGHVAVEQTAAGRFLRPCMYADGGQGLNNIDKPLNNNDEGVIKIDKGVIKNDKGLIKNDNPNPPEAAAASTSISDLAGSISQDNIQVKEKENKEKEKPARQTVLLTVDELKQRVWSWLREYCRDVDRETRVAVYRAVLDFYEPRVSRKEEPLRSKAGVTALLNRLGRESRGDPALMIDMLETATSSGWKSIYPPKGRDSPAPERRAADREGWD